MLPKYRKPTHPGEVLLEEFLKPKEMTQARLAEKMGVPIQRVNTLIKGKRDVTPETAILLSQVFGTSPEFWMSLQSAHDLFLARQEMAAHAA